MKSRIIIGLLVFASIFTLLILSGNFGVIAQNAQQCSNCLLKLPSPDVIFYQPFSYTFDNVAFDASGNELDGTVFNAVWDGNLGVSGGGSFKFDGTNDYIDFGDVSSVEDLNEITVSAWVKASKPTTSTQKLIVLKGSNSLTGSDGSFYLYWNFDEKFVFSVRNSAGVLRTVYSNNAYADTEWHNVVGIMDAGTVRLYVDGALQTDQKASVGALNHGTGKLTISALNSKAYNGSIDEVLIFNRALNGSEVSDVLFDNNICFEYVCAEEQPVDEVQVKLDILSLINNSNIYVRTSGQIGQNYPNGLSCDMVCSEQQQQCIIGYKKDIADTTGFASCSSKLSAVNGVKYIACLCDVF